MLNTHNVKFAAFYIRMESDALSAAHALKYLAPTFQSESSAC